jgi:hypothetical protein
MLDVNGTARFRSTLTLDGQLQANSIYASNNAIVAGSMGVGTTDPGAFKLNVNGGARVNGSITVGGATDQGIVWEGVNTDYAAIKYMSTGDGIGGSYLDIRTWDNTDEPIVFGQSSTERMRIHTNGFLGVGTNDPGHRLDVNGNARVTGDIRVTQAVFTNTLSSQSTTTVSSTATFVPNANNTLNLGSSGARWATLFTQSVNAVGASITGSAAIGASSTLASETLYVNGVSGFNMANGGYMRFIGIGSANCIQSGINSADTSAAPIVFSRIQGALTTEWMRIRDNGNVGIGSSTPNDKLDVAGNVRLTGQVVITNTLAQKPFIIPSINNVMVDNLTANSLGAASQTASFFTNVGNMTAGTLSIVRGGTGTSSFTNNSLLYYDGVSIASASPLCYNSTNSRLGIGADWTTANMEFEFNVEGNIYATDDIIAFSDQRFKTDLMVIHHAVDKLRSIQGYTFSRVDREDSKRYAGVLAQEVQRVLPEVVYTDSNGVMSVAYGNMVALLVQAVKEQQDKITEHEQKLQQQQLEFDKLKAQQAKQADEISRIKSILQMGQ